MNRIVGVNRSNFRCSDSGCDRGSVTPLVALLMLGLVLSVTMIGVSTEHYVRSARAQWAADAAALAAAANGLDGSDGSAARVLAEANGAVLVSVLVVDEPLGSSEPVTGVGDGMQPLSPVVVVEVEFDGVRARSAARRFAVDRS